MQSPGSVLIKDPSGLRIEAVAEDGNFNDYPSLSLTQPGVNVFYAG